ncbi:probable inactive receptor kinase At5g67200 [Ricinus communis]|uniref:probable inactive receptor kinase At5g67200 n=1 Tax=Ricinus communis TaxID=3988 RepID=UPI00201B1086|nr:probable inactive receptor kinase At5g67200 [Ricinus communis]
MKNTLILFQQHTCPCPFPQSIPQMLRLLFSNAFLLLSFSTIFTAASTTSDATALLAFKSTVDLNSNLPYSQNTTSHFCEWVGIKCFQRKVVRLVLHNLDLGGTFAPDTLTLLDQLRVLSLQNNSITGPIPDLSKLVNLKSLFLDHNSFTASFPPSLRSLHRLRTLDLSHNNLSGPIPTWLSSLDRLYSFRLDSNRFNGSIPPLNQSSLKTFNVSYNNFTGAVPVTPTLLRFDLSSFLSNPNLCGEIIHKECHPSPPFFGSSPPSSPPPAVTLGQSAELHGVDLSQPSSKTKHKRTALIIGFASGVFIFIGSLLCFAMAVRKQRNQKKSKETVTSDGCGGVAAVAAVMQIDQQENELEEKVKRVQGMHVGKSGCLLFCAGEAQLYTLDQLMRASAELLGRGTIGTTYKAVLDNRLIVCVKRLDASKLQGNSKDDFERHMESVGGLRHPNLVPLRAYFQAREERLLIYDYQPNGSLFSLIHGSKSTRAKPLHWTSCLKIAEDVAQGLSYIHQAWRLVHGNLKSSNVLLGPEFEACIADYCLAVLATSQSLQDDNNNPDATAYKAPETRNSTHQSTSKSDVFSFGILLLELLTGKPPSQLPFLVPDDMMDWVRSAREDDGSEDSRLEMLLEVALACSSTSPEQRPTMWQVLKMLQEIKETVLLEDSEVDQHVVMS